MKITIGTKQDLKATMQFDVRAYSDDYDLRKDIESWLELVTGSPDTEYDVEDFDYEFPDYFTDLFAYKNTDLEAIVEYSDLYVRHGDALKIYIDYRRNIDVSGFEYCYHGRYDSTEEFARQLVEDGCYGDIPEQIQNYIDYSAIWEDLRSSGEYYEEDGYIFKDR